MDPGAPDETGDYHHAASNKAKRHQAFSCQRDGGEVVIDCREEVSQAAGKREDPSSGRLEPHGVPEVVNRQHVVLEDGPADPD